LVFDGANTIPVAVPLVGLTDHPLVFEIGDVSVLDYRSLECPRQDFFFDNDSVHCSSVVGYVHNVTGSKDLSSRKLKKVSNPFTKLHPYDNAAKGTCSHNEPKNKCFLITVDVSENVHCVSVVVGYIDNVSR
tara:strand:+ start:317 stop:712 length:396 start_codon:yes stop_codon:yes gene_type:complete